MLYDELTAQENLRYFASLYPGRHCLDTRRSAAPGGPRSRADPHPRPVFAGHAPAHLAGPRAAARARAAAARRAFLQHGCRDPRARWSSCWPASARATAPSCSPPTSANWPRPSPTGCWPCAPAAWPRLNRGAQRYEDQRRALPGIPRHSLRTPRVRGRSRTISPPSPSPRRSPCRPSRSSKPCWSPRGPNIYRFAVIPGDAELDFKKLARAAGLRKAEMAPLKDVQPLTGYIRGGVTALRREKALPGLHRRNRRPL